MPDDAKWAMNIISVLVHVFLKYALLNTSTFKMENTYFINACSYNGRLVEQSLTNEKYLFCVQHKILLLHGGLFPSRHIPLAVRSSAWVGYTEFLFWRV